MWLSSLKEGLAKSRDNLKNKLLSMTEKAAGYTAPAWEELEEILISADLGTEAALKITGQLKEKGANSSNLTGYLKQELILMLGEQAELPLKSGLNILLLVGVNGAGKTTTLAKLAAYFSSQGKKILIAAGDTFRAAAIEQLDEWASRTGSELIRHQRGSNPSSVIYDAAEAALARATDILIADTAGRLHTHENLMEELKKIKRVAAKVAPEAKIITLLVVDATMGQNSLAQAKVFKEEAGADGIILTKLDGTAKGGIAVSIRHELELPVYFVTFGESADKLSPFNPQEYVEALLS